MESILVSIKKMLGVFQDGDVYDVDLIFHINTMLMTLFQLGAFSRPFSITGPEETWDELLEGDPYKLEAVKSFVYLKVKLIFDPPSNSFVIEAYERQIAELEWRITQQAEGGFTNV